MFGDAHNLLPKFYPANLNGCYIFWFLFLSIHPYSYYRVLYSCLFILWLISLHSNILDISCDLSLFLYACIYLSQKGINTHDKEEKVTNFHNTSSLLLYQISCQLNKIHINICSCFTSLLRHSMEGIRQFFESYSFNNLFILYIFLSTEYHLLSSAILSLIHLPFFFISTEIVTWC